MARKSKYRLNSANRKIVNGYFELAAKLEIHQRRKLLEKIIRRLLPELFSMQGRRLKKHKQK